MTTYITVTFPSGSLFPGADTFPDTPDNYSAVFRGPTRELAFRMEGGLFATQDVGLSVWRIDGAWFQGFSPTDTQLAAADRIYSGGRVHPITDTERDELFDAGFGDYITLEVT